MSLHNVLKVYRDKGLYAIGLERRRQIEEEGFTAEHDDDRDDGALTAAANCYLGVALESSEPQGRAKNPPADWPWDDVRWKPDHYKIKNLKKAGALVQAEMDRLTRLRDRIAEEMGRMM